MRVVTEQVIPEQIWEAYEQLVKMGSNRHSVPE